LLAVRNQVSLVFVDVNALPRRSVVVIDALAMVKVLLVLLDEVLLVVDDQVELDVVNAKALLAVVWWCSCWLTVRSYSC
jgi:enamine deaminase RidA (YjgF/YER057c/UK114 family)